MGYQKNSQAYLVKFTENCFLPYGVQDVTYAKHSVAELEELLTYEWSEKEFQKLIRDALNRTRFDPHLKNITDVAIITTSAVLGLASGTIAHSIGADPLETGTVTAATGTSAKSILDDIHKRRRKASDTLTVFYQKARQII